MTDEVQSYLDLFLTLVVYITLFVLNILYIFIFSFLVISRL
jgi:hypothetical protein